MIADLNMQVCEYELQFANNAIWCKVDAEIREVEKLLETGLLRNVAVDRIKMFTVADSVSMVYDIKAALSGSKGKWYVHIESGADNE